jgi:putative addiction module killer protein
MQASKINPLWNIALSVFLCNKIGEGIDEVRTTQEFDDWLDNLRNRTAVLRISTRIDRIEQGNFGDTKVITEEISELRFFFGSGYRIYYTIQEKMIIILINGGDKSSQKKDIKKAKALFDEISGENNEN